VPNQELLEQRAEVDLSEKVFTNSPNMLVLCLTVIGLIKIYTRFEKITTLAPLCASATFFPPSALTWRCEARKNRNG